MVDLERKLIELGGEIEFPETPEIVAGVFAKLPKPLRPRTHRRRWIAAVAAVAIGVLVVAVPGPRAAIADLLGIGSVQVTVVDRLPSTVTIRQPSGVEVALDDVRANIGFDLVALEITADSIFVDTTVPGGMVTLAYRADDGGYSLLITQLQATTERAFVEKLVGPETTIIPVDADGGPGYWIVGDPHVIALLDAQGNILEDEARLAANTLLVLRGELTVRIEGALTLGEALEIEKALR